VAAVTFGQLTKSAAGGTAMRSIFASGLAVVLLFGADGLTPASSRESAIAQPAPHSATTAAAAAAPDSPQLSAFKQAIRARYAIKEQAFAAHDAETIVTRFYTADVISVGPEGIFVGRDQIRPLYQEVVKNNLVKIDSVHTFVNGDAGWDWTDFNVTPTDGKTKPFTFAILFLWTKVNGVWMCKGDFFVEGSFRTGKLAQPPSPSH
jgi:ketosteroid isomerase-like protein